MDYQQDLYIDKGRLDQEWLMQPILMGKYNSLHAQAILDRDRAKQFLDVTKAQLIQSIRAKAVADGEKFGAGGVTDSVVDARMKSSKEYIDVQERFFQAEHKVNVIFGAVMAFQARKTALENLVKLYLSGYWATPKAPDIISQEAYNSESNRIQAAMQDAVPPEMLKGKVVRPFVTETASDQPVQAGPQDQLPKGELAWPLKQPKPLRRP